MRLIDADALMEIYADRMSAVAERYSIDSSECGILSGAMKLLDIQPTIERPTSQWIPVSKEKPRDGQKVLITYEYQYGTDVVEATFDEMRGTYYRAGYPIDKSSVIAWMPRPKAYEVTE